MNVRSRILIALGVAEGLTISNWARVYDPGLPYWYTNYPKDFVLATYAFTTLVALVAFACTYLPRQARWLFIPFALLIADSLRIVFGMSMIFFVPLLAIWSALVFRAVKKEKTTWLDTGTLILQLLGVAGIATMIGGAFFINRPSRPVGRIASEKKSPDRIVLAIFDELDPVHAIEQWPKDRPENEFQRLAKRSLFFQDCEQPGPETLYSIPAMTIGRQVQVVKPTSDHDLDLTIDGKHRMWDQEPNIILEAQRKVGASVLGWYHPYERIYKGVDSYSFERIETTFMSSMWLQASFVIDHPFKLMHWSTESPYLSEEFAHYHVYVNNTYLSMVKVFIEEHQGLIILHVPCPHAPFIMNPVPGDKYGRDPNSYYGNVEHAAKIFREIERTLKDSGQPYTLVVTSDHNLRISLAGLNPCGRVPMMITGSNLWEAKTVSQKAYGEHVADVIRNLIDDPKAPESKLIEAMTAPRTTAK